MLPKLFERKEHAILKGDLNQELKIKEKKNLCDEEVNETSLPCTGSINCRSC